MQPSIERKIFLIFHCVQSAAQHAVNDKIPAVGGYDAWHDDEWMLLQKTVAESLLACSGYAGHEPVGIWHILGMYNVDPASCGWQDVNRCQHMRRRIQCPEPLVNCNFEDGR